MHIANIHESEQWANEISILFGVIGIILLGKILNMVHIIWIWTCQNMSFLDVSVRS